MAAVLHMKRNVSLLALCQGYAQTSVTIVITVSALAGAIIAEEKSLATLPHAFMWLATAAAAMPASLLMKRFGRRGGFAMGSTLGMLGCALCTLGVYESNLWIFICGTSCMGAFNSFNQYLRFAAAETADEKFRPTAIALVIGGGVVAAFVGGAIANGTKDLLAPVEFAGTYVVLAVCPILLAITIQFIRMPEISESAASGGAAPARPLPQIMKQPAFVVAAIGTSVSWAGMILMMAATPLSMKYCRLAFGDVTFVIQWHMFAMFAPSFIAGWLIARFGNLNVILMGFALFFVGIAAGLSGISVAHFFLTNIAIGAGWNLMLIGSTALLVTCHTEAEKGKVQGANDTIAYLLAAISSFFAGYLQIEVGWNAVMIAIVPQVVVVGAAVWWMRSVQTRTAAAE
jgi:MFS family permease